MIFGGLTIVLILIALCILAVILLAWVAYNGLVKSNIRADEAWSDITVQLKRRMDLIPNLVQTVKGYAKHEAETLQKVVNARAAAISGNVEETAKTENMLSGALKSLFAVAESHPDLKANQNFAQLQEELVDTEDKIQGSRRFYNAAVRELNTKIQIFPSNIFAGIFGFKKREFFEVEDRAAAEKPVDVQF